MNSIWINEPPATTECLSGRRDADVVVVGAGITGLTTAWRLAAAGAQVVVLEARDPGGGNTGRSTGNLYSTVSTGLAGLLGKWPQEEVALAVAARTRAIAWIESVARELAIDCGLHRVPLHQCVLDQESPKVQDLRDEHEAALRLGLPAQWLPSIEGWPLAPAGVHTLAAQAHFNPWQFTQGLARALRQRGVGVYAGSRVLEVDPDKSAVVTAQGRVRAGHIVLATHTPLGINLLQTRMEVYREYGVAGPLDEASPPAASVWVQDDGVSLRTCDVDGQRHLVIVGEKHKTGEEGEQDHAGRLRDYGIRHFGIDRFNHAWSAQQYRSADGLPYIGRSGHRNVLVATGLGADGLVWGTVAGEVIESLVLHDREEALGRLLSPRRLAPVKSARGFAAENATVARHMVSDRIKALRTGTPDDVAPGDGGIMRVDGESCAVHRTLDGQLLVLSAVCPHMKCLVQWNASARTWDCPCHGSRFDVEGQVIEGPSLSPLERRGVD